jgi:LysB family phage lysis regulatory protein
MTALKAIALAIIIFLIGALLVGIQQYRVIALRGEVAIETKAKADALAANVESQATITTLRAEIERNKAYQFDLDKRLKASEQKAQQARKDFEDLKRKSPAVRKWADQPLPDGLRGKPASTVKTTTVRLEPPELVPCERISESDDDLALNGDLWALKDRAVNLLDTCADQVDAQILRSKSK